MLSLAVQMLLERIPVGHPCVGCGVFVCEIQRRLRRSSLQQNPCKSTEDYVRAYEPSSRKWGDVRLPSAGRPSTVVVWPAGKSSIVLIDSQHLPPPSHGRVLILAQGLEGFITNLQFLVTAREELPNLEVHIGYRLMKADQTPNPNIGQEFRNGTE